MSHAAHIARHLAQLADHYPAAQLERVVARCELVVSGDTVRRSDGNPVGDADCICYLTTLAKVFGSSVAAFARVNFILAGCAGAKTLG